MVDDIEDRCSVSVKIRLRHLHQTKAIYLDSQPLVNDTKRLTSVINHESAIAYLFKAICMLTGKEVARCQFITCEVLEETTHK